MKFRFKTRIALYYLMATTVVVATVFFLIFFIVKKTVYDSLDQDLSLESNIHLAEIDPNSLKFENKEEWEEREHREVQVNPVFVQVIDQYGHTTDKSPNLKESLLSFDSKEPDNGHFNTFLNETLIRQTQLPIQFQGKTKGYILTAMSFESSRMVIIKLRNILLLTYPMVVFGLFFISRFLAGRSIEPIREITDTTRRIHRNNLSERVTLPANEDELYELSASINELLQRIEDSLNRERQFTSDASHELRTPLASLRGTLEVLVRKGRSQEEYEKKINYSLKEVDRMCETIDKLLFLARYDHREQRLEMASVIQLLDETISRNAPMIADKKLKIQMKTDPQNLTELIEVPRYYASMILDNILSNAIKYSHAGSAIQIDVHQKKEKLLCRITDTGIGIAQQDLKNLFNAFYRSEALDHKDITGTGLGLSIAKKAADAIDASIKVASEKGSGTTFEILFSYPPIKLHS
ncbi:sensor histidine kinase [Robertkochia solimangrovi]|uniref:sensor histidine kinase n=1 Tax=Robertkochia solimangrovi TaxID=2213046 RepID=UPI00117D195F|nr:ATP-binding protein [Robertkochia solimangrovi]TRZ43621.1 two-component sensor histidine kinase [Robertkochia solimangrovi]